MVEGRRTGEEEVEGWWKGAAPLVAKLKMSACLLRPNWFLVWTLAWYWEASDRWERRAVASQEVEVEVGEGATSMEIQLGEPFFL